MLATFIKQLVLTDGRVTTNPVAANPSLSADVTGLLPNANLANMAQSTVKGRASGAGTGVPVDLTVAQVKTIIGLPIYSDGSVPAGNTTTATTETALASTYTIPAASVAVGDVFVIKLGGTYSGTILPTIRGKVKLGSVVVADTTAISGLVTGSGLGWRGEVRMIVTATGAGGTVEVEGWLTFSTAATAALSILIAGASYSIDWTASQAITITVQWGAGGTAQTITMRHMIVSNG